MLNARKREDGQAILVGIVIGFVMLALIGTLFAISTHSNDATSRDRSRTQGIQSAETAVSLLMDQLQRTVCPADVGMSSPVSLTVGGKVVGQYQGMVRLPTEAGSLTPTLWNPNQPTSAGCTTSPPASGARTITAWGYGPQAGSARRVLRRLQVDVQVAPFGGFRFACFAGGGAPNGVLTVRNNMQITGNCYARSISDTNNNLSEDGTLISPGPIEIKNDTLFAGNVWAGGAITVGQNTVISGYATSATSSIHLENNVRVLGNATAGTAITLDGTASISGIRCPKTASDPGCPTVPPPTLSMPTVSCADTDFTCWSTLYPGMVTVSSAQMSTWLSTNKNNLTGAFYVNDSATINFKDGGTITGPLTIVTQGKIDLSRALNTPNPSSAPAVCTSTGPRSCYVTLVSLSPGSDSIHIYAPKFTANGSTLSVLLYSKGTVQIDNGATPTQFSGAIYGSNLAIDSNGMYLTHSQDFVDYPPPFVSWAATSALQFTVVPTAWRELTPALPGA